VHSATTSKPSAAQHEQRRGALTRVVRLDRLPLVVRVGSVEVDVGVRGVDPSSNVHLDPCRSAGLGIGRTFVRGDCDVSGAPDLPSAQAPRATHLHELGEDQTGRARTDEKHFRAKGHSQPVHAVDGARGGFDQRGLFVGEIVDFEAL
jgi:hypothetical protein